MASIPVAGLVGYLLLLSSAATRAPRATAAGLDRPTQPLLVLIPAHNEEHLLPQLLASLAQQTYPAALWTVHVVADNCTDQTAAMARAGGATVHERRDTERLGKGHALNWLLARVDGADSAQTALVFLDADSVVSPNFLSVMAARLAQGQRVIQAYYAVRNPGRSVATDLRFAALAALHYLRPQGRMVLGGSAGLKGNGMVLAGGLMRQHHWSTAVTEDIELHMALLLAGERVYFAPDAIVWGEMPDSLAKSQGQHQRWETGRLQMARQYIPRLVRGAATHWRQGDRRQAARLLDAALEHTVPPFAVLAGLSALLWTASVTAAVMGARGPLSAFTLSLTSGLLAGQAVYLLLSLHLARAPRSVYLHLLYAPAYIGWKLKQYAGAWLGRANSAWIRTTRNES